MNIYILSSLVNIYAYLIVYIRIHHNLNQYLFELDDLLELNDHYIVCIHIAVIMTTD
jgi:hypothetical protein